MAIGLGTLFVGYTLLYFGICSMRGPGVGLFDLVVPGRTVVIPGGADLGPLPPGTIGPKGPRGPLGPLAGGIKGPQGPNGPVNSDDVDASN